jgi:hypothetical protein
MTKKVCMSPDLAFWLALAVKMGVTASFVVLASLVAQRAGPLIGAMVSTLPISAGPAYVFLALDHPPQFIAQSALASLVTNAVTAAFCLVYAVLAQRRGTLVSYSLAMAFWVLLWVALQSIDWTFERTLLLTIAMFAVCIPASMPFRKGRMPPSVRRWYDLPLRAAVVAALISLLVTLSPYLGPTGSGMLAVWPIVLSSVILILQPRVGGRPTAAVIANAISGLGGFAVALSTLHLTAVPLGTLPAVCLLFVVSFAGNASILLLRRAGIAL